MKTAIKALKTRVKNYTAEEKAKRDMPATPTYPELEKRIDFLTEEDMHKIDSLTNRILKLEP